MQFVYPRLQHHLGARWSHAKYTGKAPHYIDLLDAARSNGRWSEIPELTRKVAKHAPQRRCLVLTAQTEVRVSSFNPRRPPVASPGNANALFEAVQVLIDAAQKESEWKEDAFQAGVCAAWIDIMLDKNEAVLATLPQDLETFTQSLSKEGKLSQRCTPVCIVRATFFRGLALENLGKAREAVRGYEKVVAYLSDIDSSVSATSEFRSWTERLLARYCSLSGGYVARNAHNPRALLASGGLFDAASVLKPYRAWAQYWEALGKGAQRSSQEITKIWKSYYDTLSTLVQGHISDPTFDSRLQPGIELKRIESIYQAILLSEKTFPRADETTLDIEAWADQLVANWRTLLDSAWTDEDLRPGGKTILGRGVLDSLYKAASRSFHSTKILRHLFLVHAAMSEFSLASKALDSYLEITKKDKARQAKSGEKDPGLDDEAAALSTIACAIEVLCTYGRRKDVEKTQDLCSLLKNWLSKAQTEPDIQVETSAEDNPEDLTDKPRKTHTAIPGKVIARAFAAIGLCRRYWAVTTYDSTKRADLRYAAATAYRSALRSDFGDEDNLEHLYSLAFVLAQERDSEDAIITVKQAISIGRHIHRHKSKANVVNGTFYDSGSNAKNRGTLLKCWHLLALLVSARQDFSTAATSCEAAFEPYGGKKLLYGDLRSLDSPLYLGPTEKRNLIELKMTHLSLIEIMDGSESTVNKINELLGLFSKLIKLIEDKKPQKIETRSTSPVASTLGRRTLRESILHMPKDPRRIKLSDSGSVSSSIGSSKAMANGDGPAIAITTDESVPLPQNPYHHQGFLGRHESNKLRKRPSRKSINSLRRSRPSSPSMPTSITTHRTKHLTLPIQQEQDQINQTDSQEPSVYESVVDSPQYSPEQIGVAMSHNRQSSPSSPTVTANPTNALQAIPSASENMNKKNPNPNPISPRPSTSSKAVTAVSLNTSIEVPEAHFPPAIQDRQARSLLCGVWLFTSAIYRRAMMIPESQKAINEAREQVKGVERSIAENEGMSAESFCSPGYGGYKSCASLWGDVCSEQGALWEVQGNLEQAADAYEMALSNDNDHLGATVALSNILLDNYANPPQKPSRPNGLEAPHGEPTLAKIPDKSTHNNQKKENDTSEDLLNRLAARDRAYGMLSTMTKSGQGWDSTDAWFALARVHEESGQAEKAKGALWWVVELEEGKGVRPWNVIV